MSGGSNQSFAVFHNQNVATFVPPIQTIPTAPAVQATPIFPSITRDINTIRDFILHNPDLASSSTVVQAVLVTLEIEANRVESNDHHQHPIHGHSAPQCFHNDGTSQVKKYSSVAVASTGAVNHHANRNANAHREEIPAPITQRRTILIPRGPLRSNDKEWLEMFGQLKWFKSREGHCLVPYKFPENPKLGYWVDNQRKAYRSMVKGKAGRITEYRMKALEEIEFVWNPGRENNSRGDLIWDQRLEELKTFKGTNGHCWVPRSSGEYPKLGSWVNNQRAHYRYMQEGKPNSMTVGRIQALQGIGFNWDLKRGRCDGPWMKRFKELKAFKEAENHFKVPTYFEKSPELPNWVKRQRREYRLYKSGKPSSLAGERIDALESLGFSLDTRNEIEDEGNYDEKWQKRLEKLNEFKAQHGHFKVKKGYAECPKLLSWVNNQRAHYRYMKLGKPSSMTVERVQALELIGFNWERAKDTWSKNFEKLKDFVVQEGHFNIPTNYLKYPDLITWVKKQIKEYGQFKLGIAQCKISQDEVYELETVGFTVGDAWSKYLEDLKEFIRKEGNFNIPVQYSQSLGLATWVRKQIKEYDQYKLGNTHSKLTSSQVHELENIGFTVGIDIIMRSDEDATCLTITETEQQGDAQGIFETEQESVVQDLPEIVCDGL